MIYIENETSYSQRIYIPRDEAPTAATTGHTFALQRKDYIVTENGTIRIHPDAGYDGISGGTIGTYVSAATGVTFKHLTVEENGLYVPTGDSAYSGVTVDVDLEGSFNSGFTSGETYQKSLLSTTSITDNGYFVNDNGWSSVTFNYPLYSAGFSTIAENGRYTYDFQTMMGFPGAWNNVTVDVAVPQTGGTSVLDSLLVSENNKSYYPPEGVDGYSAVTVDINLSTLYAGNVIQNGHYVHSIYDYPEQSRPQGWRQVEFDVNVPQGYTQEEVDRLVEQAYNDGYEKGFQDGVESVISGNTYVNVNPEQIKAESSASTSIINITSNSAWTITAPIWVSLSTASGTGNTLVTVTINQNTGITRNGVITVIDTTTQNTDNVIIIQKGESDGDYSKQVFTIEVTSVENNGYIDLNFEDKNVYMSINDNPYVKIDSTNKRINPSIGDTIKLKGDNATLNATNGGRISTHLDLRFNVYGNIMSLFDSQNFDSVYDFEGGYDSNLRFFFFWSNVVDASNLILPVTSLTKYCYQYMFHFCRKLISAPALPATTLEEGCYEGMFTCCDSLINAPELPAETVPTYGYNHMFTLCRSLSYLKCMAINKGNHATSSWVNNVAPTGTFVKASGSTWDTGKNGIPDGWTVIDE